MKGVVIRKTIVVSTNNFVIKGFIKSMMAPVIFGIYGFSLLLSLFILIKFISYLIGNNPYFSVNLETVGISIVGFVLFFLIRLIEVLRGMKHKKN